MASDDGNPAVAQVLRLVSNTRWSQDADGASAKDLTSLLGGIDVNAELERLCRGSSASDESVELFFRALRHAPDAGYGGATEEGSGGEQWGAIGARIVQLTAARRMSDTKAAVCFSGLKLALPGMAAGALAQLTQALITAVHDGSTASGKASPLELLPDLLDLLAKKPSVPFTRGAVGAALTITGMEYRRNALGQLTSADLNGSMATEVAKVLREVPLDPDVLLHFLGKCVEQFKAMDLEALPSLIYQLLLLSNRRDSVVKRLLLCSICGYFDTLDGRAQAIDDSERMSQTDSIREPNLNTQDLRAVEGTVILQIHFAVTQDQKLGKDFLKLLSGAISISPFSLALLFSLSKISYLEDEAFKLLKGAVTSCHTDEARRAGSQWISQLGTTTEVSLKDTLLKTVKNSASGWDHITPSLVKFGFVLVDTTSAFGRSAAQEFAAAIGFRIVVELFELHEMVRSEILEQCFTRIITHATSVDKVVTVLQTLIKDQPQVMMDFTQQIKDLFDYVSSLSPDVAAQLLKAVQPLLRLRPELFDYVVLVFRKAVFNKEPTSRLIAVTGFVELVQLGDTAASNQHSQSGGGSQGQGDLSHAEQSSNEMRMQAFGLFRRCLTQQCVVRERVYSSLTAMFAASPASRPAIMELLASQWSRYYCPQDSDGEDSPPFDLKECTHADKKGLVIEEPLSALIRCVHQCCCHSAVKQASAEDDDGDEDDPWYNLPKELWDATVRMSACTLDDFGLAEDSDVSDTTEWGQQTAANVFLLQGVCEAIMECSIMPPIEAKQALDARVKSIAMAVFESLHSQLSALSKTKPKGGTKRKSSSAAAGASQAPGGGGSGSSGSRRELTLMSLPCITQCLESLTSHKNKGVPKFRTAMVPFRSFLYKTCSGALNKLPKSGCSTDEFETLQGLALSLIKALQSHREEALQYSEESSGDGEKGKKKATGASPTVQALQCLSLVVLAAQNSAPRAEPGSEAKMRSLLSPCAKALDEADVSSTACGRLSIHDCFEKLGELLVDLLGDGTSKEPEILLGIMWTVVGYMDVSSSQDCSKWFEKLLANNFKTNAVGACKAAARLVLRLYEQQGDAYLTTMRSFAVDIRIAIGTCVEIKDEDRSRYPAVINDDSAVTVAPVIVAAIQGVIDEVSWALGKLKDLMVSVDLHEVEDDFATAAGGRRRNSIGFLVGKIELATHERMDQLVSVIEPLSALEMPKWATTEMILRVVVKLFRELKVATKLLCTVKVAPPRSFKKLMTNTQKRVTINIYVLLGVLSGEGGNMATTGAAKKELVLIPNLVYTIEDLEKELIKYGKQQRENLMKGFKRSTVRDFKIDNGKIIDTNYDKGEEDAAAEMQQQDEDVSASQPDADESEEEDEEEEEEEEDEEEEEEGGGAAGASAAAAAEWRESQDDKPRNPARGGRAVGGGHNGFQWAGGHNQKRNLSNFHKLQDQEVAHSGSDDEENEDEARAAEEEEEDEREHQSLRQRRKKQRRVLSDDDADESDGAAPQDEEQLVDDDDDDATQGEMGESDDEQEEENTPELDSD